MDEQQKKCMDCRECCEYVEFPMTMLSMEVLELFVVQGVQLRIDPQTGVIFARVHEPCVHLDKDGCGIYEERPSACRAYMCLQKDKTVKQAKEDACKATIAQLKQAITNYKQEQANDNL